VAGLPAEVWALSFSTTLTPLEVTVAETLAAAAEREAVPHGYGLKLEPGTPESAALHLIGTKSELALARLLGLYPNLTTYLEEKATGGFDLPHRVCVRATEEGSCLLIRPADAPAGRYVGTVVSGNRVTVLGWEYGRRCKREEWRFSGNGRPACFLVPGSRLQPLSTLVAVVAVERIAEAVRLLELEESR
jgi:hypothetical protein